MNRPSRQSINIRIAKLVSERGTCARLQVGAVITQHNKIISTGYNGPGSGEEHCNEFKCRVEQPCKHSIHAEFNAVINAKLGFIPHAIRRDQSLVIYVTHQPCLACANLIEKVGITEVYYMEPYRDTAGLEYLLNNNIKVNRIDEQGNPQHV